MSPEFIIALLSAPLIMGLPAAYLKFRDSRHMRRAATQASTLERLEQENVRASEKALHADQRIYELEHNEDRLRAEIHMLHESRSRYRRRLIELGHEVTEDE